MNAKDREDFTLMKADVKHTKENVRLIKEDVSNINANMTKISNKLFNDDLTGEEGLIQLTKRNGVRLTKLENFKVALLAIYAALSGALGWFIKAKM